MEMKVSDLLDRWTILRMKARYDDSAKKELIVFDQEVQKLFKADLENYRPGEMPRTFTSTFLNALLSLQEANAKTWENESAIRNEYAKDPANTVKNFKSEQEYLIEVGRKALAIRDYNKIRISAKNLIDKLFGQIPDVKVNHASQ